MDLQKLLGHGPTTATTTTTPTDTAAADANTRISLGENNQSEKIANTRTRHYICHLAKKAWSHYWSGPDISCKITNTHNTNDDDNSIFSAQSETKNDNTTTINGADCVVNVTNHSSATSALSDTFRCILETFDATTHTTQYNCNSSGGGINNNEGSGDADNETLSLFTEATNDCVINTKVMVKPVHNPVSEFNLALTKFQHFLGNEFASNDQQSLCNDSNSDSVNNNPCNRVQNQMLHCVGDNQTTAILEKIFVNEANVSNVTATATATTTSVLDEIICHLKWQFDDKSATSTTAGAATANNNSIFTMDHISNFTSSPFHLPTSTSAAPSSWQQLLNVSTFVVNHTLDFDNFNELSLSDDAWSWPSAWSTTSNASNLTDLNMTDNYGHRFQSSLTPQFAYNWNFLFVIIFIFAGGLGNILVCLAVALDRKLQNVTNYFLFSLAIADLLVSLFVMPMGIIPPILGK